MSDFIVHLNDEAFEINEKEAAELDSIPMGDTLSHVLHGEHSYTVEIVPSANSKHMTVTVNGNPYSVRIEDHYDQMVQKMGLLSGTSQKINEVKAPMPGLILAIKVEPGQEIQKDDQLLILSAMKMENIILAPGEGVVKAINAKEGEAVDKGQVIIELE